MKFTKWLKLREDMGGPLSGERVNDTRFKANGVGSNISSVDGNWQKANFDPDCTYKGACPKKKLHMKNK